MADGWMETDRAADGRLVLRFGSEGNDYLLAHPRRLAVPLGEPGDVPGLGW